MKIKNGLLLKEVAGEYIVVSVSEDLNLDGLVTLNDTAVTLWSALEKGVDSTDALIAALLDEYEVDEALARKAVDAFISRLEELSFLE